MPKLKNGIRIGYICIAGNYKRTLAQMLLTGSCFKKDDQCQMAKQETEEQAWDWAGRCRPPPDLNKTGPFLLYSLRHSSSIASFKSALNTHLFSSGLWMPCLCACVCAVVCHWLCVCVCVQLCATGFVRMCARIHMWACMCVLEVMRKMLNEEL